MSYEAADLYRVKGMMRSIACPFPACVQVIERTDRLWVG
jgi:hypothetical protein